MGQRTLTANQFKGTLQVFNREASNKLQMRENGHYKRTTTTTSKIQGKIWLSLDLTCCCCWTFVVKPFSRIWSLLEASTIWINNLNGIGCRQRLSKKSAPKPMLITTMLPEEPRYSLMTVCPSNHQCCPAIVHCYALLPSPQQHAVAAAWPRPHGHLGQQTSKLWHHRPLLPSHQHPATKAALPWKHWMPAAACCSTRLFSQFLQHHNCSWKAAHGR